MVGMVSARLPGGRSAAVINGDGARGATGNTRSTRRNKRNSSNHVAAATGAVLFALAVCFAASVSTVRGMSDGPADPSTAFSPLPLPQHLPPIGGKRGSNNNSGKKKYSGDGDQPQQQTPKQIRRMERAAAAEAAAAAEQRKKRHRSFFTNFKRRSIPAVVLMAGLYSVMHRCKEIGLQAVLLLVSPLLYNEVTEAVLSSTEHSSPSTRIAEEVEDEARDKRSFFGVVSDIITSKWWWFIAYSLVMTIPSLVSTSSAFAARTTTASATVRGIVKNSTSIMHFVAYCMILTSFGTSIIKWNGEHHHHLTVSTVVERADDFLTTINMKNGWIRIAIYHTAIVFTLLPVSIVCSFLGNTLKNDYRWIVYTWLLVIVNDTAAYIVGSLFGRHSMLPVISPKKTWEGYVGAMVLTMAVSRPLWDALFVFRELPRSFWYAYNVHSLVVATFVSLIAPLGGYLASSLKRVHDIKDFATYITGHGGILDRIDCQLIASTFAVLYCDLVKPANRGQGLSSQLATRKTDSFQARSINGSFGKKNA